METIKIIERFRKTSPITQRWMLPMLPYQLIKFRIKPGALAVAGQTIDIKLSGKMAEDAIAKARAIALKLSGMI